MITTQINEKEMPKFPGLTQQGSRYVYRVRLPKDLSEGKVKGRHKGWGKNEVFISLGTEDRREALRLVKFEALKLDQLFDEERRRLRAENGTHKQEKRKVSVLSENEVMHRMTRWFLEQEKEFAQWYDETGLLLSEEEKKEVLDTLRDDEIAYDGYYLQEGEALDFSKQIGALFKGEGIELDKDSEVWKKLNGLVRRGSLELTRRKIDFLQGEDKKRYDEFLWRHLQPELSKKKQNQITFAELCERFLDDQKRAKRSRKTMDSYVAPIRIMKEVLGEMTLLEDITHTHITELADFIKQVPPNATKKFPKMTMKQVVEFSKTRADIKPISPQTAKNYYKNVLAIFNYAVDTRLLKENPAKDRWLRDSFNFERNNEDTAVFSMEELNKLFHAPPFIKTNESSPKRTGYFWIPLIALFHGMRMNEICQLYTEDIKEDGDHLTFRISNELDKGVASDKRLKNKASKRQIPVHPEMLKMGFEEFVEQRRLDKENPRLFPEIKQIKGRENYSESFSAWFGKFSKRALGYKPEANFHKFRHMFRDKLTEVRSSIEITQALGGWKGENRSAESLYGKGPTTKHKFKVLSKVKYKELDLSHLYQE